MYNDANCSRINWFVYCLQPQRGRSTPSEKFLLCVKFSAVWIITSFWIQQTALLFPVRFIWCSLWVYQWTNGHRVPLQGYHSRGQLEIITRSKWLIYIIAHRHCLGLVVFFFTCNGSQMRFAEKVIISCWTFADNNSLNLHQIQNLSDKTVFPILYRF